MGSIGDDFVVVICTGMSIKHGKIRPGRNLGDVFQKGPYSETAETEAKESVQRRIDETSEYVESINKTVYGAMRDILSCKTGTLPGDPFSRILPKLRMKEIEESVKKLKLDGSFSSKQCLSSSREDGFITQVKGEDYSNCFGIESVLKYVNASRMGLIMDKLSLTKGMWLQQNEGDPTRPSGRIETLSSIIGPCIYFQSIMPYVSQLRICHDVIITCRKQADGFRTFANCIVSNYEEVLRGQMAFVHGIYYDRNVRSEFDSHARRIDS